MAELQYTATAEIPRLVAAARAAFDAGKTKPVAWRIKQLKQIKRMMEENQAEICDALHKDLRRPQLEAYIAEVASVVGEVQTAIANLQDWMQPETVTTPAAMLPGSSYILREPLGVVLIVSPWNFPLQLCINPCVGAVAAGNAIVIKPSEVSPACAALMGRLIPAYLDPDAVKVVQGGVAESGTLLEQRFDHIMYTGNSAVAKVVAAAAAKHLTPVSLELGGKSPAIVDATANISQAAHRIVSGKCLNAGQVCIAPDYVLVERSVADALVAALKQALLEFYGKDPQASPDFGRIVNRRHFDRVNNLLKTAGGAIECGGQTDAADLYIAPTIIREPRADAPIAREEIFGPLLPVYAYGSLDEAVARVRADEKPLALYVFSTSGRVQRRLLGEITSGGAVINDTVLHNINPDLPFGGVGHSGTGAYHGRAGFLEFSHSRAVFHQSTLVDTGPLRYPPYSGFKQRVLGAFLTGLPHVRLPFGLGGKDVLILGLAAAVGALAAKLDGRW